MKRVHPIAFAAILLLVAPCAAFTEQAAIPAPISLHVYSAYSAPLIDPSALLAPGFGIGFVAGYRLPFLSPVSLRFGLAYLFTTTLGMLGEPTLSFLTAGSGLGLHLIRTPVLGVDVFADAGFTWGFINSLGFRDGNGILELKAGLEVRFYLSPGFSLAAGIFYADEYGLYGGPGLTAGVALELGGSSGGAAPAAAPSTEQAMAKPQQLEGASPETTKPEKKSGAPGPVIDSIVLPPVFPVFFKYYDEHPLGSLRLTNDTGADLSDVSVSVFIRNYMGAAQQMKPSFALANGESREVTLHALFSEQILAVTERTRVQAELTVRYTAGGSAKELVDVESLVIVDRNGMTWDDTRKAAPFVTSKDTPVMTFAKNVAGAIKGKGSKAINANLSVAMAMHEALNAYGISYVVDPKSAYADFSVRRTEVDYLQFPRQTFLFKSGDCDDLSILSCALLQSVGVETAFITVPGHIFMAFSLGMKPNDARALFTHVDNLIFQPDQVWVPIEVTQIDGGLLKAWDQGARQWREYSARNQAGFFPLQEAWKLYEPVFFKGEDIQVSVPSNDRFLPAYLQQQIDFIDQEIGDQVIRLQAEIQKSKEDPKSANRLGVLYARYGLYDRAQKEFQKIVAKTEHGPALCNLGNIAYAQGDLEAALAYYLRAYKVEPDSATVLLGLARVNHNKENYGEVRTWYARLGTVDSALAERFAYLGLKGDEATRAADMSGAREALVWEE